jgi:hypothetical protein
MGTRAPERAFGSIKASGRIVHWRKKGTEERQGPAKRSLKSNADVAVSGSRALSRPLDETGRTDRRYQKATRELRPSGL